MKRIVFSACSAMICTSASLASGPAVSTTTKDTICKSASHATGAVFVVVGSEVGPRFAMDEKTIWVYAKPKKVSPTDKAWPELLAAACSAKLKPEGKVFGLRMAISFNLENGEKMVIGNGFRFEDKARPVPALINGELGSISGASVDKIVWLYNSF